MRICDQVDCNNQSNGTVVITLDLCKEHLNDLKEELQKKNKRIFKDLIVDYDTTSNKNLKLTLKRLEQGLKEDA